MWGINYYYQMIQEYMALQKGLDATHATDQFYKEVGKVYADIFLYCVRKIISLFRRKYE